MIESYDFEVRRLVPSRTLDVERGEVVSAAMLSCAIGAGQWPVVEGSHNRHKVIVVRRW